MPAMQWLGAWLLFILLLITIAKTRAGNTLLYYLLWVAVIFLLLSHYKEIAAMFAAGGITPNG
jgi:hypothetical protein